MIHFFVGTGAELIKVMPIMLELRRRGVPYRYVDSGQHARTTRWLREDFGLGEPDLVLGSRQGDVASMGGGLKWLLGMATRCLRPRRSVLRDFFHGEGGICLVHGDTASTLVGCLLARRAGLRLGHIEAGLRSRSLLHPFPEEITRLLCMRLCHYLFAPSQAAASNLAAMRLKGQVVPLPANTVVDALRLAEKLGGQDRWVGAYALATCHRLETISSKRRLRAVLEILRTASETVPVLFVRHEPTGRAMDKWELSRLIEDARIKVLPPQRYRHFLSLLRHAEFVLTDGGSIQEECFYLGKPCFLMRRRTERQEGLGQNAVLAGYDDAKLRWFLANYHELCGPPVVAQSPSAVIVDSLERLDAASGGACAG